QVEHALGVGAAPEDRGTLEAQVHDAADGALDPTTAEGDPARLEVGVAHQLAALDEVVELGGELLGVAADAEASHLLDDVVDLPGLELAALAADPLLPLDVAPARA